MNAQSACAGHFVELHLAEDSKSQWSHFDIAGQSMTAKNRRGTGHGVALLYLFLKNL